MPADFEFGELPEDFEHFEPILEAAMRRLPALQDVGIRKFFNGPESFTPDERYMLGEAPELRHLFVAAGFNSIGIQSAGGAGKVLAEWIVGGHPPMDLWDVDIRRLHAVPVRQALPAGARGRRRWGCSMPCTGRTGSTRPRAMSGCRRCTSGSRRAVPASARRPAIERPNWFAPKGVEPVYRVQLRAAELVRPMPPPSTRRCARPSRCSTMTSFAKFRIEGRDAERVLQSDLAPTTSAGRQGA